MGKEVGEGFKEPETYVYLWLIHVDVWQKPSQYCKVIIIYLKHTHTQKKKEKKEEESPLGVSSNTEPPYSGGCLFL